MVDSIQRNASNKADFVLIDSNLKLYSLSSSDTVKLNLLHTIIENCNDERIWPKYNRYMYTMAEKLAVNEKNQILKNKYLSKKATALNNYGYYIQNYTNNPKKSLALYKMAAKIQEEIGDKINLIVTNNNIANVSYSNGKILDAIDIYHKTIKLQEEVKDNNGLTPLLNNLGEVYLFLGDTTKAYLYIKRALSTALQSGDKRIIAQEFQNIGILANNRGQSAYAFVCLRKALAIREEIGDVIGICKSKMNLAVLCMIGKKNYPLAKKYLEEVKPLAEKTENVQVRELYHSGMAQLYSSLGDDKNAIVEFETSLKLAREINSLQEESKIVGGLIILYTRVKNKEKELDMHRRAIVLNKILNTTELKRDALRKNYEFEFSKKEQDLKIEQALKDGKAKEEKQKQKIITLGISFILVLTLIFSFFIFKAFKLSKQKNVIIFEQKLEVEKQKHLIEEKQKEIVDSINYAKRIQNTLLANEEVITRNLSKHFILFKPKDIISGDFYWANAVTSQNADLFFMAVCDSTGHGVPGAFMSLLNTNFLNEAINEKNIYEPHKVFNYVRNRLINSISKENQKDGFDGILICIDKQKNKITYAAANNAPILINTKNELTKLSFDKMPVGKGERDMDFVLYTFDHQKGDKLYLYTDGFADQFGGPGGKKFKYKPLNELLVTLNNVPLNQQSDILGKKFLEWKGDLEQVDDVCIVGIEL
ncbi:MAG: tetratricopeptide repeat protein [Bacteroidetes bacterium]|nr:tetratricopeptide repeat protein [Bacteroidota bacterium]